MGKTKRAKKIKFDWQKIETKVARYNCPSCKTTIIDHSMQGTVLVFECSHCGQKLIVDHE